MLDLGLTYTVNVAGIKATGSYVVSNLWCSGFHLDWCRRADCHDVVVCWPRDALVDVSVRGIKSEHDGATDSAEADVATECSDVSTIRC